MANMIEMPIVNWGAPENAKADRIARAYEAQEPIEVDGAMVIVTDFDWPKGSDNIRYKVHPA